MSHVTHACACVWVPRVRVWVRVHMERNPGRQDFTTHTRTLTPHTVTHACTRTLSHAHTHAHTHTQGQAHAHKHIQTHANTCTQKYTHAQCNL